MHKLMKTESDPVAVATAAPAVTPLGKHLVETVSSSTLFSFHPLFHAMLVLLFVNLLQLG